ncbi:palmitoyltransferase ZDHHC19-like [Diceros bicornis minor]|uniref:palmitoyltransferase ZDHHC19-like n=1 Tax=Diceros bicornis minor TaxID=77932 RepID=UPI0026E92A55|nr:palmitoyltransferase ZDHHC19-like [Diceros bicornis minor]
MPLTKGRHPPPQVPIPWLVPSLLAAFSGVLLVAVSGLFFGFPCRWLAQNGEWAFPVVTGPLFVLTFGILMFLNISDPGILHQGSNEQGPRMVRVVWAKHIAFRLQWCPQCCFHRPPRTYHCPWCNICVEDFDHHCRWVNNCIGHRNLGLFILLLLCLCLYLGSMLVTCMVFLLRTTHLPFSIDKVIAIVVVVPAAGFLVPLLVLLLMKARSVSTAQRSYEDKYQYLHGHNPFDLGCGKNWYWTLCAALGPKYMSEAVGLQRVVGPDWVPTRNLHFQTCPSMPIPEALPGLGSGRKVQPLDLYQAGQDPPGSGEAAALQELKHSELEGGGS